MFTIRIACLDCVYQFSFTSEDFAYTFYWSIKCSRDLPQKQLLYYSEPTSNCGQILQADSYI